MALVLAFFCGLLILPVDASLAPGASIQINSTPSGADVSVDGYFMGSTPVSLGYLVYGDHVVSISREGYQKYFQFFSVAPYGPHITINASLVPDAGPVGGIHVRTTPFNVRVCVDHGYCQGAPADFHNLSGYKYHLLTVSRNDTVIWEDNVVVFPGATTEVHEILQQNPPVTGVIEVNASPPGGLFCIDEVSCRYPGRPHIEVPANRYHTVTVVNNGYRPFSTEIYVPPNQTTEVKIDLQPVTIPVGTIEVNTTEGGTVCLDGVRCDANVGSIEGLGRTFFADVPANARHSISVNKTGYLPSTSQVSVDANKMVIMTVPLRPVEPESTNAMLTELVNICSNWDLLCNHMQEKTKDTNLPRKTGQLLTTIPQVIQGTNPYFQTTAVPAESPNLYSDIVKQGDIVSLDLFMGDNENNISIDSHITLFAGQISNQYYLVNGTSNQSPGSNTFTLFSDEYNAISSGIIGMKPGEQKNISFHFKDKIETQTLSSESLKRFKIDASNLSLGKLIVGTYNAPNNSSPPSTRLGKVVSGTRDYAIIDYSYPDIQVKILQIWNGSINTTPAP